MQTKTPVKWEEKTLGEVCELINRGVSPKYAEEEGLCVLNQKCIRNHEINYQLARLHDYKVKPVNPERLIKLGDVLINSTGTGTLGRVAQARNIPPKATVDSHVTIVRPKSGLFYNDFFGYALILIENKIAESGEGCGGQTELSREKVKNTFTISYPESIDEQQRIVEILDKAFEDIDQLSKNAKQNLQNTKDLFESHRSLAFSTNNTSWAEKSIIDICKNLDSKRVPITQNLRNKGIYPYYGASGIVDYVDNYIFDEDLLLVSEDGANLLARTYPIAFSVVGKIWVNNHAHVLKFENIYTQKFVEYYLNSISLASYVTGMAQPKLNQAALNSILIKLPSIDIQQKIVGNLDDLQEETKQLEQIYQQKIEQAEKLKQSILQKAFNGEL